MKVRLIEIEADAAEADLEQMLDAAYRVGDDTAWVTLAQTDHARAEVLRAHAAALRGLHVEPCSTLFQAMEWAVAEAERQADACATVPVHGIDRGASVRETSGACAKGHPSTDGSVMCAICEKEG